MVKDFYITLIYKELEGSITAEEQVELNVWSSQVDNLKLKSEITNAWNLSSDYSNPVAVNLDHDFSVLQLKMDASAETKVVDFPKPKSRNWLSMAAGIAILVAALFAVRQFTQGGSELVRHTAERSGQYYMLEDGSEIYLKEGSSISYHQPLNRKRRTIHLEGEGVFHVAHDASWPLDVKTDRETITVLGTQFHVKHDANQTTVQLIEGKVEVRDEEGKSSVLIPGQKIIFNADNKRSIVEEYIAENEFAWQSNRLVFENEEVLSLINTIEAYYGVSIQLQNPSYGTCRLTAVFDNKTIDQVLETISKIHEIEVEKVNGKIILKGGKCE